MTIENVQWRWSVKASADLNDTAVATGHINKAVSNRDGDIASNGLDAVGMLYYGGKDNEHISFAFMGIMKATAAAAISSKDTLLTVTTSGYVKPATDGDYVVGRALSTANSGSVFDGLFDFSAPYLYQSAVDNFEFTAQADLSSGANKFVDIANGDFAATSNVAGGVLSTGTTSGGTCECIVDGVVEVKAGGVIGAQDSLKVASGWAVAADSGDLIVGRALDASASGNSGSTFTAVINMATPHYATSCLDVQY